MSCYQEDFEVLKRDQRLYTDLQICSGPIASRVFDADFTNCQDDLKLIIGYIFMLVSETVSWKNEKEKFMSSFTIQAEFIACFLTVTQVIWLGNFTKKLTLFDFVDMSIQLYCNNNSVVSFIYNNKGLKGFKYSAIKFFTIKETVHNGDIAVKHISTDNIVMDLLTKGLRHCVFERHAIHMGLGISWDIVI